MSAKCESRSVALSQHLETGEELDPEKANVEEDDLNGLGLD